MELLPSLVKFDFCSHPLAVVLSFINRMQSCWLRRPARMSTHRDMTVARCLSRLFHARSLKEQVLGQIPSPCPSFMAISS
jgi:hypothetical protein